jgi:hypothetical protein
LLVIEAPHFCAGVELQGGHVIRTAPILAWMMHKTLGQVQWHCRRKRWKITVVETKG